MVHDVAHRGRIALPALLLALALLAPDLRADDAFEEAAWTSPLGVAATVCQGNGGSRSHTDPRAFYAWDYDVPQGTPIVAARDGVVEEVVVHNTLGGAEPRYQDKANRIVLKHADGLRSVYAHLRPGGACVRAGERVLRGETIGWSGNTGYSSGPHLHFAVVDSQGISVPVQFGDFELGDGVPWDGDRHPAAPAPTLPQKDIDACRAKLRAAGKALEEGWPEVGLLVVGRHLPRRADAEHPLHLEVAAVEARCQAALAALAQRVSASPEADAETVFRLVRAVAAADQAKAPRDLRDRLHAARRALEGDAAKEASALRSAAGRLVKGMAQECLEDGGAAKAYAALLGHTKEAIRTFARARFDHLVATVLSTCGRDVARLKESAREAGPQQGRVLLEVVEATLEGHRSLLEQAARARTERGAELKAALRQLRADEEELETLLS